MTQLGTTLRTDLTQAGGSNPRQPQGRRGHLHRPQPQDRQSRKSSRCPTAAGAPISPTPEFDYFDPDLGRTGNRIAFVSDRGGDNPDTHTNYDIYLLDLRHPTNPPASPPTPAATTAPPGTPGGKFIYFRSNRGGSWQVSRIAVK